MTAEQPWPWPETMDALLAAPASHRLLLENDRVRVLDVLIGPRAREPEHTHQAPSIMIVDEPARIRYYAGGALRFESPPRSRLARGCAGWNPAWNYQAPSAGTLSSSRRIPGTGSAFGGHPLARSLREGDGRAAVLLSGC